MEKTRQTYFEGTGTYKLKVRPNIQGVQNHSGHICATIGSRTFTIPCTSNGGHRRSRTWNGERAHAERHRNNRVVDYRDRSKRFVGISSYFDTARRWLSNASKGKQKGCNGVDPRNYERLHANRIGSRYRPRHSVHRIPGIRKLQMVCKTILKPAIPVAALSAGFLGMSIHKAQAADLPSFMLEPKGPLWGFPNWHNPLPLLPTPHSSLFDNANVFFSTVVKIINFFQNLPHNMIHYTNVLTGKVFEWLILLLQTPLFIFNATNIHNVSLVFSGISILIVTILTMIEGIKRMMKVKHTDVKRIYNRYFVALLGAGIAPVLFEGSFGIINALVRAIGQIGGNGANDNLAIDPTLLGSTVGWVSALGLVAFDIVLIAVLIPVLLQNARRFFDLMVLCAITPLALTAWIFDDYRHFFSTWWNNVKKMSMTPLVYSIFVCMIGLLIFGTNATTWSGLFMKLIILIGGLYRMTNPPSFLKREMDIEKSDIEDRGFELWNNIKNVRNNLTLKNYRSGKFISGKLESGKEARRSARIQSRLQRGTRSK